MSILDTTIQSLELLSDALDKAANKKEMYNDDWAEYLEHMSHSLYKDAQWLKQKKEFMGGICEL